MRLLKKKSAKKSESKKSPASNKLSVDYIADDIIKEGKTLHLQAAPLKIVANQVAEKIVKKLEKTDKRTIKKSDLNTLIAKEIKGYSKDLSFVYQNRGKII